MTEPEAELTPDDRAIAEALMAKRPTPAPTFRGTLGDSLVANDPGYGHRPMRLWAHVGALAGAGGLLVLFGLLVSTGAI